MVSFTFVICVEPYKFEALDSLLNLGNSILKKGHSIKGIYLYGSGVYNLKKDSNTGKEFRNLPKGLNDFCKDNNIQLGGCSTWVSFAGIGDQEIIEAASQKGLGELSEWIEDSDNLIVFGGG